MNRRSPEQMAWLTKWSKRYGKLCGWVEENIEQTLSFYRLPRQHHKNMKSTNMLDRLMKEIKRRTVSRAYLSPMPLPVCVWFVP
jgi:putative transposase